MVLTKDGYIPRLIDPCISRLMGAYGAVCIEGTKFCGKTWTASNHANSIFALDDMANNYSNLTMTRVDPMYALDGERPHLIDEWQLVPSIWDGVRRSVDDTTAKGLYILCGSSVANETTGEEDAAGIVRHSGFGRICKVRMRTMSLFESGDSDGSVSLRALFEGGFRNTPMSDPSMDRLIDLTMRGGWPGNLSLSVENAVLAVSRYPDAICEDDVKRVDPSKDRTRAKMLMRSLARNESNVASNTTISRDLREYDDEVMSPTTVSNYAELFDRMFLTENQPAFDPNVRSSMKVGKMPKRHLTDPALAIAALRLSKRELLGDLVTFGLMFEALCERDLQIYASVNGGKLYHYRDGRGNEIDAVVEMPDGSWGAFEIRLGTNQIDDAAAKLARLRDILLDDEANHVPGKPRARPPSILAVICGMAPAAYRREDGVHVIPITSLRD